MSAGEHERARESLCATCCRAALPGDTRNRVLTSDHGDEYTSYVRALLHGYDSDDARQPKMFWQRCVRQRYFDIAAARTDDKTARKPVFRNLAFARKQLALAL